MQPLAILETSLYVDDLVAAEAFYRDTLGLEFYSSQPGRHVFFRCGGGMLLIFDPAVSGDESGELPAHGARGSGHVAFAVAEESLSQWRRRLEEAGVQVEREMEWPRGGRSFYFRDPAGNSLELATPRLWGH